VQWQHQEEQQSLVASKQADAWQNVQDAAQQLQVVFECGDVGCES
jgi:dsDNA-binding SOS-regulon protein